MRPSGVAVHNPRVHIAILTFQGFNELDSIVALGILNRVRNKSWRVSLCCPDDSVTSMNGVVVQAQSRLGATEQSPHQRERQQSFR